MNQNKTKLKNIEKNTNKRIIKMRKHKNRQIYKQTERQTEVHGIISVALKLKGKFKRTYFFLWSINKIFSLSIQKCLNKKI